MTESCLFLKKREDYATRIPRIVRKVRMSRRGLCSFVEERGLLHIMLLRTYNLNILAWFSLGDHVLVSFFILIV